MNEEQLYKIEGLTLEMHMELEILNSALKYMEMEGADVCALSSFVEKIYEKSDNIRKIF